MKKLYYDDLGDDENLDAFDENGFETVDDMFDSLEEIEAEEEKKFEDPESDESDRLTNYKQIPPSKNLLAALRTELGFLECDRGVLLFRTNGIDYEGVPMLEITPNKFVFKVTSSAGDKDTMKAFLLSNLRLK